MIYCMMILILIFQGILVNILPVFNNIDEIITILLILICFKKIFINKNKIKLYKYEIYSFTFIGLFFILGFVSYIWGNVDNRYLYAFISGILSIKSFLIYFLARICMNNLRINNTMLLKIRYFFNILLWGYTIVAILNIPLHFLKTFGYRNGIPSIAIGFNHPAIFEYVIISLTLIQFYISVKLNLINKSFYINLLQCILLVFLAGRAKGIAFIAVFCVSLWIVIRLKKFKMTYLLLIAPIGIYLVIDRIKTSFFNSTEARSVLYSVSYKIAKDYFPLGSGFSTFGSDLSRKNYSPLYYQYGISNVWGLTPSDPRFITDTQWASVLGETGFLGFTCFIISVGLLLILFYKIGLNAKMKLALIGIYIYALMSSISDSILVSFRGAGIFLIMAIFISIETNTNRVK